MAIIAVTNLKGGCGKSTIAINLAVALHYRNFSTCILDTDKEQRSAMKWSGDREADLPHISVYGVESTQVIKESAKLAKQYDVVIIDGSPQLADLADSTMLASDIVLIPAKPSILDFRSMEEFIVRYRKVKALKDQSGLPSQAFIVLNDVKSLTTFTYQNTKAAVQQLGEPLLYTIPNLVAFQDSLPYGKGVVEYSDQKAKQVFNQFTDLVAGLLVNHPQTT